IIVVAAGQWRPWIKEARQARINRQALMFAGVAAAVVVALGFAWTGSVKSAWRAQIWSSDVAGSPIEKMQLFFSVADDSVKDLDADDGAEALAGRLSSSSLYFSYVLQRVPHSLPHENGALAGLAISNLKPRFLFPDKRNLGGDSWLVRQYAGIEAAGDESGASIGLGYLSEFYVDFGVTGVVALGFGWGAVMGAFAALLAKISPSREVFFGLIIVLYMQYMMAYDGSFVKLFPGAVQLTIIAAVVTAVGGRILMPWLLTGAGEEPAGRTRMDRALRPR
ncbi:MAG: oligosaccharide repeat unit polymerase, partial [Gammaproteobacteria bacterium]|nr:oligosaccharide repeat unit polymerase [Gammaproteobacteria bacterium]